jgi:hypothetical protein
MAMSAGNAAWHAARACGSHAHCPAEGEGRWRLGMADHCYPDIRMGWVMPDQPSRSLMVEELERVRQVEFTRPPVT